MFIAKNNDLIILAKETREELEQALQLMVYTSIEETDIDYQLYNGKYLTPEQIEEKERERLNALSMTRSDFFDGMIMAFGLDSKELRIIVENVLNTINITPVQIRVALNNYDNALNFYRKHTLFELINGVEIPVNETMYLLFTPDIWDKFFDTKDYTELQKAIHEVEPKPEPETEPDEGGDEEEPVVEDDNIEESEGL